MHISKNSSPEEEIAASFEMNKINARVEEAITFTNTSSYGNSCKWDFGDDNSSTEENPTHSYSLVGDYTISLTVDGDKGVASITKSVTIWDLILESTYYGESVEYEGPTLFRSQTIKFHFHNQSESIASANLVKHNEGYSHKDMRDLFEDGIYYGRHPEWTTEIIGPWNEIDAGKTHTWLGKLEPEIYSGKCQD